MEFFVLYAIFELLSIGNIQGSAIIMFLPYVINNEEDETFLCGWFIFFKK